MTDKKTIYARYLIRNGETNLIPNRVYQITIAHVDEEYYSALYVDVLILNREYPTQFFTIYYDSMDTLLTQWQPMQVMKEVLYA